MDNDEICKRLKTYTKLICGEKNKQSVFCKVTKQGNFKFGYWLLDVPQINKVTRQTAIGLIMGLSYYIATHKDEFKELPFIKTVRRRKDV